jgi:hypothetical protein
VANLVRGGVTGKKLRKKQARRNSCSGTRSAAREDATRRDATREQTQSAARTDATYGTVRAGRRATVPAIPQLICRRKVLHPGGRKFSLEKCRVRGAPCPAIRHGRQPEHARCGDAHTHRRLVHAPQRVRITRHPQRRDGRCAELKHCDRYPQYPQFLFRSPHVASM